MAELKHKVVGGMAWTAVEKITTGIAQLFVSLIVVGLLVPQDYGLIGILAVFTMVCSVVVDSGFSSALIRKQSITDEECNAVFLFNIGTAIVLYGVLTVLLPTIAGWFPDEHEAILRIAPVMFLFIPINAAANVQLTVLNRRLDFRRITHINIISWFAAAGVAVAMALAGFGVWALVGQRITQPLVRAVILWCGHSWRPRGHFSLRPLRPMMGYGSRLLLSDLANTIYANISQLFIGRIYNTTELGYYDQGRRFKDLPVTSVTQSIQTVTFPALATLQAERDKMAESARKVVVVMNFLILPMMAGLIAVAPDIYRCFLKPDWFAASTFFRVFCIAGFFAPVSVVSYNILKVYSDGRMLLINEVVKKGLATLVLVITIPISPIAIAWGQTVIFLFDAIANHIVAGRYVRWRFRDTLRHTLPYVLMTTAMVGAMWGVGLLLGDVAGRWILFTAKIAAGIGVYGGLTLLLRPEAWREAIYILRNRG